MRFEDVVDVVHLRRTDFETDLTLESGAFRWRDDGRWWGRCSVGGSVRTFLRVNGGYKGAITGVRELVTVLSEVMMTRGAQLDVPGIEEELFIAVEVGFRKEIRYKLRLTSNWYLHLIEHRICGSTYIYGVETKICKIIYGLHNHNPR